MDTDRFPFITFSFDTRSIPTTVWFLLGEALSECQHLAGSPLKPRAAADMAAIYLARGVQATTAIEGNTLTADEVKAIVVNGSAGVSPSREYLEYEVRNVLALVRDIDSSLRDGVALPFDRARLEDLNAGVLAGIPDKPEVVPGRLREHDVAAGRYLAPHWTDVPELIERFTRWLRELRASAPADARPDQRFVTAVLAAILAHLYIAWIHPFGNGNGRVARLVEVQILSESGVVPLVATNLLSDHYDKTRSAYYLALDAAQRDVSAFVEYAVRGFVDELREQIEVVKKESMEIHWESYVYELFRSKPSTPARDRQRELALALFKDGRSVTPEEATELSISLARTYAPCGARTPVRDLNDLTKMLLAEKVGRRFRARSEVIRAFIPPVANV